MIGFILGFATCVVLYAVAGVVTLVATRRAVQPHGWRECVGVVLTWPFIAAVTQE